MLLTRSFRFIFGALALILFFVATASAQNQAFRGKGKLDVLYIDDFDNQKAEIVYYFIPEGTRERLELIFEGEPPPGLRTGQTANINRGKRNNNSVTVQANGTGDFSAEPVAAAAISGERRAVVILVNFTDSNTPPTPTQAAGMMWTDSDSIDKYFQSCSHGNLSFPQDSDGNATPDVFGPFNVNYSSTDDGCDYYGWANAAEAAATNAGVDFSLYQHRVFVLPNSIPSGCDWAGVANLGCGSYCRAWIYGRYWQSGNGDIWAHELGHNLNLHHASIPGTGESAEYGDRSDVMGYGGVGLRCLNSGHYNQTGWTNKISTVTAGTHTLHATQTDPATLAAGDLQVIKIDRPNTSLDLYLSFRQPAGFDSVLSSTYQYATQVIEHNGSSTKTLLLATLKDGQSYTDPVSGATITQSSHTDNTATVNIGLECFVNSPSITLSPATRYTDTAGTALAYNVTLSNNDANCGPTTFSLSGNAPAGWTAKMSTTSFNLDSGQNTTAVLTLTSDSAAADGSYSFSLTAQDNDGHEPNHSNVSTSGSYIIDGTPPGAVNSLTGSEGRRGRVELSWNAVSDNPGGSGLSSYRIYRDGVLISSTSSTSYTDSSTAADTTYSYYLTAVDNVGNASAHSNTVTVTTTAKKGGPKGGGGGDGGGGNGGGGWGKGGKNK